MTDQVTALSKFGSIACWWDSVEENLSPGGIAFPSLIYASPEAFLHSNKLREFIKKLTQEVVCIAIDEAHYTVFLHMGGESDFRSAYASIGDLRAFFSCPILALTANATSQVQKEIKEKLHFRTKQKIVVQIPIMQNITFKVFPKGDFAKHIERILSDLKNLKSLAPRRIVFCSIQLNVGELFSLFQEELRQDQFVDNQRLFAMYHKDTPDAIKKTILTQISMPDSPLRCVFATIAFGMGVDSVFRDRLSQSAD
eukprot:Pompholyxophrys_punicea_v1_NODE_349_length_2182_cov_7.147403.p1 type:complete len:254 gc:universal NODE_349_length_2182_cov_7.147403:746-1507(+)